ncbi:MAG: flavodoxin family protein [Spirochaetota bacterium]|nr:MAG: flavodoxin family protein [Spirochaetota bacterium]UCC41404.1 MAG: flavodoxin family protein [Candidatus Aminicenantes bacterium]
MVDVKVLILYDSVFGNTERIALAISDALSGSAQVRVVKTGAANPEEFFDVDLAIVGSPTHRGKPTECFLKFLEQLHRKSVRGLPVAVFDTRYQMSSLLLGIYGSAARKLVSQLKKLGGLPVIAPESFIVCGREGPLENTELTKARSWAKEILEKHSIYIDCKL